MATPQEESYLSRARQIKAETAFQANTAPRVGGLLEETLAYIFGIINQVSPGTTSPQFVSVYSTDVQYALDINNPRAVLWPNAANQIRLWALKPSAVTTLKFRNAPSYQANSEWFDLGTVDQPNNPDEDLSNYYDKTEINNLLAALARSGFQFIQIEYTKNVNTFSVPDYITATNLKFVDILAGPVHGWDLNKTLDEAAHTLTLTDPPADLATADYTTGSVRVWYLANEGSTSSGGSVSSVSINEGTPFLPDENGVVDIDLPMVETLAEIEKNYTDAQVFTFDEPIQRILAIKVNNRNLDTLTINQTPAIEPFTPGNTSIAITDTLVAGDVLSFYLQVNRTSVDINTAGGGSQTQLDTQYFDA